MKIVVNLLLLILLSANVNVLWGQDAEVAEKPASITPVPRDGGWMKRHESMNERAKQGNSAISSLIPTVTCQKK